LRIEKEMNIFVRVISFGKPSKQLIIQENKLVFDHSLVDLNSVTGLKYGMEAIRLEMFSIGIKYLISFRTGDTDTKIIFRCYFGFGRDYFNEIYKSVLDEVWESTAVRLVDEAIGILRAGRNRQYWQMSGVNARYYLQWGRNSLGRFILSKELQQVDN
jgi:hypothetical protein